MAINKMAPFESKTKLSKELGVSRASLYYKPKLPGKDLKLKAEIERVMRNNKAYGHKRVAIDLGINKKRVLRVMKLFNLKPQRRRRKRPEKPKDLNQKSINIPNLLTGTIVNTQNQIWASDFTYLSYFGRFLYLATVVDLFTREIIGWEISTRHNAELITKALLMALDKHQPPLINHSDKGSEYCSQVHLDLLNDFSIVPSMSEKASPWQNGKQESFYSGFKLELGHPEVYPTLGELIEAIASQIHYYNYQRIHTVLKCPPAIFAKKMEELKTDVRTKVETSYVKLMSNRQGREIRLGV